MRDEREHRVFHTGIRGSWRDGVAPWQLSGLQRVVTAFAVERRDRGVSRDVMVAELRELLATVGIAETSSQDPNAIAAQAAKWAVQAFSSDRPT